MNKRTYNCYLPIWLYGIEENTGEPLKVVITLLLGVDDSSCNILESVSNTEFN